MHAGWTYTKRNQMNQSGCYVMSTDKHCTAQGWAETTASAQYSRITFVGTLHYWIWSHSFWSHWSDDFSQKPRLTNVLVAIAVMDNHILWISNSNLCIRISVISILRICAFSLFGTFGKFMTQKLSPDSFVLILFCFASIWFALSLRP